MNIGKSIYANYHAQRKDKDKQFLMTIMAGYIDRAGHYENKILIWKIRSNMIEVNRTQFINIKK